MIDKIILKALVGTAQQRHLERLSQITHTRFSTSKTKPTITFVNSPVTGAQIDVVYSTEEHNGVQMAFVTINLPLASATVGHNYFHAGLESIKKELGCASRLCRIVLAALGFNPKEIDSFRKTATIEMVELTWHTRTASTKAMRSLLMRTKSVFDTLQKVSSRHDTAVSNVDYKEGNGKPGMLVRFKSGDMFRQYAKIDQIASRNKKDRKCCYLSPEAKVQKSRLLDEIKTDVRNELLIFGNTLRAYELSHPGNWTTEKINNLIRNRWNYVGLGQRKMGKLSPQTSATLDRYYSGEDLSMALPAHTITRHRKSILEATNIDIALPYKPKTISPESVGYQLQYGRHCEPKEEVRELVLCKKTASAIIVELEQGFAFIESGEIPDIADEEKRSAWLARWSKFINRESGHYG